MMVVWLAILTVLVIFLGAFIMITVPQINQRITDLKAKLDTAIQNQQNQPPPIATQADLDAIAAGIEEANTKADTLLAPPTPAP